MARSVRCHRPIFVGDRRRVDDILHAGARLPDPWSARCAPPFDMMLERGDDPRAAAESAEHELVAIAPGSLGSWSERGVSVPATTDVVSPLAEIERAVQERAKDISLDMSSADGAPKLRAVIDDEVAQWGDDYRRGRRDFDLADPALVAERAFRNLAGYGPLEPLLRTTTSGR